jgi:TetR/AcrR family acrAB operon transcriptional repressor
MRRTKADAQHTREALLDAAELLFAQRGVSRTSLQEIAKAAGLTRGAVYWHFKDKAELFNAMMERSTLPMEEAVQNMDPAPEAALNELVHSACNALHRIAHDPRTHRVFDIATHKVEYVDELTGVRQRHLQVHQECQAHIRAAFERAQGAGLLQAQADAHLIAMSYHAMIDGLINTWMLDTTAFDLVEVGQRSIALFIDGLRVKPA